MFYIYDRDIKVWVKNLNTEVKYKSFLTSNNKWAVDPFTIGMAWWVNRVRFSTGWLIRQVFLEHKQKLTNHIAKNDKFLTAHISKYLF